MPARQQRARQRLGAVRDKRLGLAVDAQRSGGRDARSLAQQAGVPVSLHGTGGAWMVVDATAEAERFSAVVQGSLDRKVCNTLNVLCVLRERAEQLVPAALAGFASAAADRKTSFKLHVVKGSEQHVPPALFEKRVAIERAEGTIEEPQAAARGARLVARVGGEGSPGSPGVVRLGRAGDRAVQQVRPQSRQLAHAIAASTRILRQRQRALRRRRHHALGRRPKGLGSPSSPLQLQLAGSSAAAASHTARRAHRRTRSVRS